MTDRSPEPPLTWPVVVSDVPPNGLDLTMEADVRERAAVSADFGVPAVQSLRARLHVAHSSLGLRVTGRVTARVTQICSVSLEPFDSDVDEEVEVDYADASRLPPAAADGPAGDDSPDPIVDGRIDVGALAAEFLALGLDPYPRKPGAAFAFDDAAERAALSPFAGLAGLKRGDG